MQLIRVSFELRKNLNCKIQFLLQNDQPRFSNDIRIIKIGQPINSCHFEILKENMYEMDPLNSPYVQSIVLSWLIFNLKFWEIDQFSENMLHFDRWVVHKKRQLKRLSYVSHFLYTTDLTIWTGDFIKSLKSVFSCINFNAHSYDISKNCLQHRFSIDCVRNLLY